MLFRSCPPPGKPHRYVFTVFALKVPSIPVDSRASGAMVGFNLGAKGQHMIDGSSWQLQEPVH